MITGVDGRVAGLRLILTGHGETGVEVGQAPGRQGGTPRHKLNKRLPLVRRQLTQNGHKSLESRAAKRTQIGS